MYSNDIDTLNTQLVGFDSQVELLEKTDTPSDDEVEKAKADIEKINNEISELKNDSGKDSVVEQLEKEIFDLAKQIVEKNQVEFNTYLNQPSEEKTNKNKINDLNEEINNLVDRLTELKIQKGGYESQIRTLKNKREELVKQYKELENKIKQAESLVVKECPTCHRPFEQAKSKPREKNY